MLPASLAHFVYEGVIDDLGPYLKKHVPRGYRNIVVFARNITIKSDISYRSTYHLWPANLQIVCSTLVAPQRFPDCKIDLSGESASDMISINNDRGSTALEGKAGCDGGSITVHAATGRLYLRIYANGGDGGKGQDGYIGRSGRKGTDSPWFGVFGYDIPTPGVGGEDGGNGGKGGRGGDAGQINISLLKSEQLEVSMERFANGGIGGKGGKKGTGGVGGPGGRYGPFNFLSLDDGKSGADGQDGLPGGHGKESVSKWQETPDQEIFYKSLPVTAAYLQRALNVEMVNALRAKQQEDQQMLQTVKENIEWIGQIAECKCYDLIQQRCKKMLEMCKQVVLKVCKKPIKVKAAKVKSCFQEFQQVAEKSTDVHPLHFHSNIQADPLLKKHAQFARQLNQLDHQFTVNKTRYANAKEMAHATPDLQPFAPSLKPDTERELNMSFSKHFSDQSTKASAKSSILKSALSASEAAEDEEVSVEVPNLLEGLVSTVGKGLLEGVGEESVEAGLGILLAEEAVVAPEAVVVEVLVGVAIFATVELISSLWEAHSEEIAKYNEAVQTRMKIYAGNRLKLKRDEKEPNPPKRRKQRGRSSESGKFIGVLDKCEPVEQEDSLVVATFDGIPLLFTTEEGQEEVDLNKLDAIQQEELSAQLLLQRQPFSVLPAFMVTTVLDREIVDEEKIGFWYEFDVDFENTTDTSDAVEVDPMLAFALGKLYKVISMVTENGMPVTVPPNSIKQLSRELQSEVVTELGLLSDPLHAPTLPGNIIVPKEQTPHESSFELTNTVPASAQSKTPVTRKFTEPLDEENNKLAGTDETDIGEDRVKIPRGKHRIMRVVVANVGQGSCNILFDGNDTPIVVFDVGYGKGAKNAVLDRITDLICDSTVIIISHWDLDHFKLLFKTFYHKVWSLAKDKVIIAPSFGCTRGPCTEKTATVARILQEMHQEGFAKFYLIDGPGQVPEPPNWPVNLELHLTNGVGQSKNNVGAITACVKDENGPLLLLPGDASYRYLDNVQTVGLKYLVATHHGATYRISQRSVPQAYGNEAEILFSYGLGNKYNHNERTAMNKLYEAKGWRIPKTTADYLYGIEISLIRY